MTSLAVLPWHQPEWGRLAASRKAGRLPHALLLAGPRGVGKQQFAHRFTAWLLCEVSMEAPCGQCSSCMQFAAGTHPSVFSLQPEEGKRDISIDAVRELSRQLALTSHTRGAKIALIQPADALNSNGVNALLKTIEEPAAGSHLLLLTERPMMLAATLRSRCQILRFGVPDPGIAMVWLRQQDPQVDAAMLARSHGAPLKVLESLKSGALAQQAEWDRQLTAVARSQESPLVLATGMDKDKPKALAFLQWLMTSTAEQQKATVLGVNTHPVFRTIGAMDLELFQQSVVLALRRLQGSAPAQLTIESVMIDFRALCRKTTAREKAI